MNETKGYLCENCGQFPAKFEARSPEGGKNVLVCSDCLKNWYHAPAWIHSHPFWLEKESSHPSSSPEM
jgi:hypothetical protein